MAAAGRTRWGWHRLADDWARRIVARAGIGRGDLVLDIGAGTGALTQPLVDVGARVIAFELHHGRATVLRARFAGRQVTVVEADVRDLRLPRRPFRVVANPPFASTTAVIRRLVGPGSRLLSADLVVARYVAGRWMDGRAPARFEAMRVLRVPGVAFTPPSPKDAALLRFRCRERP